MAKKTIAEELKQEGKSYAKRTAKKGVKKAVRNTVKEIAPEKKKKGKQRPMAFKILPYFLTVLALILVIFFVTVHIVGEDAGFLGNFIDTCMGGFFGGAAVIVPFALGYIGVKWCIYNVKWKEEYMKDTSEVYEGYKKAKRRMILQGIMTFLVILTTAGLFGVIEGYDATNGFDIIEMWENGAEELFVGGGGVFGSGLAALLVAAVRELASVIILVVLLVVFALFMIGLTPDYIVGKIRDAAERSKIRKQELAQERRREAEAEAAEAKRNAEIAAKQAKEAKAAMEEAAKTASYTEKTEPARDTGRGMSADDIADMTDEKKSPVKEKEIKEDPIDTIFEDRAKSKEKGGDFGGEPGIDTDEFDMLDDILNNLDKETGEVRTKSSPTSNIDDILTDLKKEAGKENGKDKVKDKESKPISLSEMESTEIRADMEAVAPDEADGTEEEEPLTPYIFPPIDMLSKGKAVVDNDYNEELQANARQLLDTLNSFRIEIKDITYSRGPTITRYELRPEAGVRVRSIANLVDDISLSLATSGVRIEAPIPGKAAVGIEVPNRNRATVFLRELIDNQTFVDAKSRLTAALGMDVGGNPIYFDISKMPHMLIAGATGMGKSVCINCIIISLLYKARPEDLKLILIDPKKVEFNIYKDIPHLYAPIVSDPKKAAGALASAVAEMERRFELIEEVGVRDIASYNAATENDPYKEHMPHMVIIIDELADLMMTAPDEVETAICRLAQKARAAGIHIIIGTQRPSVDVITGLIKANIPSRIACTVASQVDSRTIIDIAGAEKLIGRGDMLFAPVGAAKPMRVQGAFVTDGEVENIVTFIRENNSKAKYNAEFINRIEEESAKVGNKKGSASGSDGGSVSIGDDGGDSKFQAAVKLAVEEGKISTSLMQRKLGVGYGRAAKIIDSMEEMGYVSKPDGNKPRRVLLTAEEYTRRVAEGTLGNGDEE